MVRHIHWAIKKAKPGAAHVYNADLFLIILFSRTAGHARLGALTNGQGQVTFWAPSVILAVVPKEWHYSHFHASDMYVITLGRIDFIELFTYISFTHRGAT